MGRRDIARYLGIAHETVSRTFGSSSLRECVRVENRAIAILDMDRLAALACNTCQATERPIELSARGPKRWHPRPWSAPLLRKVDGSVALRDGAGMPGQFDRRRP